jgi:hypothetical protein
MQAKKFKIFDLHLEDGHSGVAPINGIVRDLHISRNGDNLSVSSSISELSIVEELKNEMESLRLENEELRSSLLARERILNFNVYDGRWNKT